MVLTPTTYWPAASIIGILSMGLVFYGTTQITVIGISLERKTKILSYAAWLTAITNIVLNWLFIPSLGALGAAIATFISYIFLSVIYLKYTQKLHPIPFDNKKILFSIFLIFISLFLMCLLNYLEWGINQLFFKIHLLICNYDNSQKN